MLGRKLQLEKNKLQADSSLYAGRVIASLAYDATKKQYLDEELNAKSNKTSIIQNKIQQAEYNKSITLLNQQTLQETYDLIEKVRNSLQKLYAVYVDWEQKYVIKSPLEGKVVFFQFWKVNQYIASGEAMVMVVPKIQNYIARASLPSWGIGKIKQDQRALIKLSEYPFQEFGMVEGVVQNISPVSMDNNYLLEINLKNGLTTTMNKQIPNQPELIGSAEVLTSDKSILARIFEKLIVISQ